MLNVFLFVVTGETDLCQDQRNSSNMLMAAIQGVKDMWLRKHDDVVAALVCVCLCVCVLAGYSKGLSDSAKMSLLAEGSAASYCDL